MSYDLSQGQEDWQLVEEVVVKALPLFRLISPTALSNQLSIQRDLPPLTIYPSTYTTPNPHTQGRAPTTTPSLRGPPQPAASPTSSDAQSRREFPPFCDRHG